MPMVVYGVSDVYLMCFVDQILCCVDNHVYGCVCMPVVMYGASDVYWMCCVRR